MAHNFVFSAILPRNRVFVAMGAMMTSMFIIGVIVFALDSTSTTAWVYIACQFPAAPARAGVAR
jgi:hypothetical protein